ncbi:MAG TPA: dihydroorotate dehydrogenase-like protein [Bacteroidales bacterium]|nr:dihydroorotate dehydrogenase-like protein [Bacteroidales bacterium]
MSMLDTQYLGLEIKSPVIVGSCGFSSKIEKMKEAETYGAGAIVMKSLFEEQINSLIASSHVPNIHPEAEDYMSNYIKSHSVDEYLKLISEAKKSLHIPVIASINCITSETWIEFARNIEGAGADAIEINMFFLPVSSNVLPEEAEKQYLILAEKLKKTIKIPIAIKIGFRFTNVLNLVEMLYRRGIDGIVMFNRFYEPDIDIEKMKIVPATIFSTSDECRYVLRWIAMTSALNMKIDISASTGVHSGNEAIKYMLAGASTVQVCSVLYKKGLQQIKTINEQISDWMKRNNFNTIQQFRGKLNYSSISEPMMFERTQFMKYFSSHE